MTGTIVTDHFYGDKSQQFTCFRIPRLLIANPRFRHLSVEAKLPYGYRKKDADSKEIVPDEETASVVKHIFTLCASGKRPSQTARILTEEKVLTLANYYYQKYGKPRKNLDATRPYSWNTSTVNGILNNKVYLGRMDGLRSTSLSYKDKKPVFRPESEHVLVENTHEALATQG